MKNIVTRAVSGTIYVAVIVSATIAGGYWFFALTGILAATAAFEYQRMVAQAEGHDIPLAIRMTDFAATMLLWLAVPAYVYTAAAYPGYEGKAIVATLIAVTAIMVLYLIIRMALALLQSGPAAFPMAGRSYLGVLYIGVPVALLNALMAHTGSALVLLMFVMIWLNDTGAYLVGSALGRHPLCKRLSPKKSQEGFWGGMAFCILAGAVYASAFAHNEFLTWATFGIIICLASTAGDLFESMMKRAANVKDSGNLIPGHGGVLDRIDSLLMAAPAAALFALARLLAQVC